jgi:hypothetical protein
LVWDVALELLQSRVDEEESLGLGIGGGRIDKYTFFMKNINLLPVGVGYSLQQGGSEFRPHSDLIRINLSYGTLIFVPFLKLVFPKSKSLLPLFLAFCIPFLVNSIIDDYKLFPLYLYSCGFLLAVVRIEDRLEKRRLERPGKTSSIEKHREFEGERWLRPFRTT